jgi:DNA-binding XRE family transcriptional regulator
MLADDRRRAGWSVEEAARHLCVSVRTYWELEAGDRTPNFETWDRISELFGWPRSFR